VLGSDVAGLVVELGDGCNRLKVGDKVWGDIGANTYTSSGAKTKELGGYGKYAVALESQLWAMPSEMSFSEAGSLPKVALTSIKALVWYAGVRCSVFDLPRVCCLMSCERGSSYIGPSPPTHAPPSLSLSLSLT
jgi:NADPH:quinone reductase-like Zn-dependent oxidoreductase